MACPCVAQSCVTAVLLQASEVDTSKLKDGVRCYMTAEGALVCEKLEPGSYK
jgi:hypothetical protein